MWGGGEVLNRNAIALGRWSIERECFLHINMSGTKVEK